VVKLEYRNPKFETNSKQQIQMSETNANPFWLTFVLDLGHSNFSIVSDFVL